MPPPASSGDHPTEIHDVQRAELVGGSEVGANTGEVNRRNREFLSPTLRLEIGHRETGRLRLEIDEGFDHNQPGDMVRRDVVTAPGDAPDSEYEEPGP